jgi:glucose/arabinose dehydrogenase
MRRQQAVKACVVGAIAAVFGCGLVAAQAQDLKKYESNNKNFWLNPPPDWFLGDENAEQKGLAPNPGQPLPSSQADLEKMLANVKLPAGFKITVWAQACRRRARWRWAPRARCSSAPFDKGTVHAVVDQGGKKVVKPFITGLRMPTGVAFHDNALYVIDIDKLYKYDNPEANLDKAPAGKVVYDDFPPYVPHGWKYLVPDGKGWFFIPGRRALQHLPAADQHRAVPPGQSGRRHAELVALGQRNSVGGAVDPRTGDLWFSENARDWMSDDMPSDKLNHVRGWASISAIRTATRATRRIRSSRMGHKCSEFTRPVVKLGAHVAPLGMKFYTGTSSRRVQERHLHRRARLVEPAQEGRLPHRLHRGRSRRQEPEGDRVRRGGFLDGEKIVGRPADILQAPDGSLLVADDQAGAIYQISYSK